MGYFKSAFHYLFPRFSANRAEARLRLMRIGHAEKATSALFGGNGGASYTGASNKASMRFWATSSSDADSDLLYELPRLRDRSQDLYRNSPPARGVIKRRTVGAVGSGLRVRATIDRTLLRLMEDQARAWEDAAEREFRLWSDSRECDFTRRLTFNEMQILSMTSQETRGDCFATLFWQERDGVPYDLRVQLIEADRVCNPNFMSDDETIAGGIEKDKDGIPIAIHVRTVHPGNTISTKLAEWKRIPIYGDKTGRRQVLHLMEFERIDQSRGEPLLAPVIELLKQLTRYSSAELTAAVVNAVLAVFIKRPLEGETTSGQTVSYSDEEKAKWENRDMELGAGTCVEGAPGEEMQTISANRPNAQFDPFFVACIKQIGMAIGVPFEILLQHFSSSYSASRAALLEFTKYIKTVRAWFIGNFCQPVYEEFLTEAVIKGRLYAPGFLSDPIIRAAYCRAEWMGPGAGMIDPVKEVDAAWKKVLYGFSTFGRETAEISGTDFEQTTYTRSEEFNLLAKFKNLFDVFTTMYGGANTGQPPEYPSDMDEGQSNVK